MALECLYKTPTISPKGYSLFISLICENWKILQQAKAEQEEEYISNTLLKKIQALKKEKETLAHHYEQEEECLTNDLSRKLTQVYYFYLLFTIFTVTQFSSRIICYFYSFMVYRQIMIFYF